MASERQPQGWIDKMKQRSTELTAMVTLGAVGLGLAGCGPSESNADHAPSSPSVSASATPGSQETTTPSATETAKSPEVKATELTNSDIYNAMTSADQAKVEKDIKLSFEEFEKLPVAERVMVAQVIVETHKKEYIEAVGDLKLPQFRGNPLNNVYIPATGKYLNIAQYAFDIAAESTPNNLGVGNDATPYIFVQLGRGIASMMAATGDPELYRQAQLIVGGFTLNTGSQAGHNYGDLANKLQQLEQVYKDRHDSDETLHFPQSGTWAHLFNLGLGGSSGDPFGGKPTAVEIAFTRFDQNSLTYKRGVNEDGMTACAYRAYPIKLDPTKLKSDSNPYAAAWVLNQCADEVHDPLGVSTLTIDN